MLALIVVGRSSINEFQPKLFSRFQVHYLRYLQNKNKCKAQYGLNILLRSLFEI